MSTVSRILGLWKSPAAVYLGASILSRAGSLLLIPLYTRRLTLEDYGRYALFLTLMNFLSMFMSAGLKAAIPSEYFSENDPAEGKRRASQIARWTAMFALGSGALLLVGVECFAPEHSMPLLGRDSLRLATVGGAGMAISAVPWTLLRSEQRAYAASAFELLQFATMTAGGLVLVLFLDRGYAGALEAAAVAPAVNGLVSLIYILRLPKSEMRIARLRRALRFTLPLLPHFVAVWLLGAADFWILGEAGFEQELGGYSLAAQVVAPVNMVLTAWNLHMGPEMGKRFRSGGVYEMRAHLLRVRLSYVGAAMIPGAALLLGLPLVAWVIGSEFENALLFVPFLLLAILPDTLYFADFQVIYYAGRSGWISGATITAALVSVALGLLLIPPLGAYGAIVARAAGALVRSFLVAYLAAKLKGPSVV